LLEEMAVLGRGSVQYVRQNEKEEKVKEVIGRFHNRISRPVLTDLAVDWKGLDVQEVSPAFVPDLFAGQPLLLHARYGKAGSAPVKITGKLRGKPWQMTVKVTLPELQPANAAMGPLWARSRISDLERLNLSGENADNREKIIELALQHKLVTRFTSFVAVDETIVPNDGKNPLQVAVEAELPEGTQYEGFLGNMDKSASRMMAPAGYRGCATSGLAGGVSGGYTTPVFNSRGANGQAKFAGSKAKAMYSPAMFQNSYYEQSSPNVLTLRPNSSGSKATAPALQLAQTVKKKLSVWLGQTMLALSLLAAAAFMVVRSRRK